MSKHHNVEVKVVLHAPGSATDYHFESKDVPIDANNVIYFSNCGKKKGFRIRYELDDDANPGFRFPTERTHPNTYLDDALWVTTTGNCPTQASKWPVFKAEDVKDQGKTLVVWNENLNVQNFAYTLRLWNGTDWLPLDPPGSNQNGGVSPLISYAIGMVSGGVAALGAAIYASQGQGLEPSNALIYGLGGAIVGLIVGFVLDRL